MRILIPLDGSMESETAFAAAMPILRTGHSPLLVLQVVSGPHEVAVAQAGLNRALQGLALHGIEGEARVRVGSAADQILEAVEEEGADLVALTTHGRTGVRRILMGSVAQQLMRRADVPLLLHHPKARVGRWSRIVVALDGSPLAEQILEDVIPIARQVGSAVQLVAVNPRHPRQVGLSGPTRDPGLAVDLERERERMAKEGLQVIADLREGDCLDELCGAVRESGAGLLALTTHGRTGDSRNVLGGVAEELIRNAPCTLLLRRVLHAAARGPRRSRTVIRPGEPLG